jgi:hypothetical protein
MLLNVIASLCMTLVVQQRRGVRRMAELQANLAKLNEEKDRQSNLDVSDSVRKRGRHVASFLSDLFRPAPSHFRPMRARLSRRIEYVVAPRCRVGPGSSTHWPVRTGSLTRVSGP